MTINARRFRTVAIGLAFAAVVLLSAFFSVEAGNPRGAYYSASTDHVFWFVQVSDLHIGARGSQDSDNLAWLLGPARTAIAPAFIVASGDLTDSTNGNFFGLPNGPYQAEWDEYKSILHSAGADDRDFFYDIPGNHDAYNDKTFAYYRANSVQGQATGGMQVSWTKSFPFGDYHFLGVNTADNTGAPFSISWPWGDYAGLDNTELAFIDNDLRTNIGANLTFIFGHHPVTATGNSQDTYLYYGYQQFIQDLGNGGSSVYGYGHTHVASETVFDGDAYTGQMPGYGVHYDNIASLGKSSSSQLRVIAVDCDGVSSAEVTVGTWPVVLITAPVDAYTGSVPNPYAYTVPASATNPIRALVFDPNTVSSVSFRVDGATWTTMQRVTGNTRFWSGTWDASHAATGEHTIEVRAVGSATRSSVITVKVEGGAVNRAPVANNDTYTTQANTALVSSAPGVLANDNDPDGDALTASRLAGPTHGTLTLSQNGGFTYTPASDFSGTDSFTYTATDPGGLASSATASITVEEPPPPPAFDTVTIASATYSTRKKVLSVKATSSAAPDAVLTVDPYGTMSYNKKTRTYTLQTTVASAPASVTVTSSMGGSATRDVKVTK
jgi:hypothetical protein